MFPFSSVKHLASLKFLLCEVTQTFIPERSVILPWLVAEISINFYYWAFEIQRGALKTILGWRHSPSYAHSVSAT